MKLNRVLLFCFISLFSFGQNQKRIDSLTEILNFKKTSDSSTYYNQLFDIYFHEIPDSANHFLNKAIKYSKVQNAKFNKNTYYHKTDFFHYKNNIDSLKFYSNKIANSTDTITDQMNFYRLLVTRAKIYLEEKKIIQLDSILDKLLTSDLDWKLLCEVYYLKGLKHYRQKEDANSLVYLNKVDSLYATHNEKNEILVHVNIYRSNISRLTFTEEGVKRAGAYLEVALKIAKTLQSSRLKNLVYSRIADQYGMIGNFDKSIEYIDKALPYFKNINDIETVSKLLWTKSSVYSEQKEFIKAENIFKERLDLMANSGNYDELANININFAGFYIKRLKNPEKAITYYEKAKKIYDDHKINKAREYQKTYEGLSKSYELLGDFKTALRYEKILNKFTDSLNRKRNTELALELDTKYQSEKKEQEIALLKSEKQLIAQEQKSERNLLLGGLGLSVLAALFLLMLFRNRQKTTKKLKELDTVKSNFFANISHEFRTPLTLISNPIDETLDDPTITHKNREKFEMAKRNADRLLSLVNQLLDLSKIDAGQLKLHIQKGHITQLVAALSDSFSYQAKQKQIAYAIDITHSGEVNYFDKDAIEKITINLLSNAIKYTPAHGSISCSAHLSNDKFSLEIKNTGPGLSQVEVTQIFQRFYQASEHHQGTGIGLALVKELVDLHKGTIDVTSELNGWTTFRVSLPVDKQTFKNEEFIDTNAENNGVMENLNLTLRESDEHLNDFEDSDLPILLIVEDNSDLRSLLRHTFEDSYKIITAQNGQDGIELALEHIPDIIISDVMMPVKDGIALTVTLKNNECTNHIPIILLTAKAGEVNELKGIEVGADDYMTKPFNSKILEAKVSKLIETRRLLQNRYSQELILTPKDIAITNLDEKFLEKVQSVLVINLVESSFSTEDFSKAVGMSRMQLHRKLKALTGLTATEFIRSQRLKLAAQLLKTSDINISQVGYSVGFNDHSYFTKCFKEAYNCTPTEFAQRV